MDQQFELLAFNRGLVSRLALARHDIKRMALAASVYTNFIPRLLGSTMLRPGTGFLSSTRGDMTALHIDGRFSTDDTWIIEVTEGAIRVRVDDVIVARPAVTSTFNDWNGGAFVAGVLTESLFADITDVDRWRDNDEAGGVSTFAAGGFLSLLGNGTNAAIRDRSIAVAGANIGKEHALAIIVAANAGNATVRIGSTEGGDDYLEDRTLRPGQHSIAFTPAGAFFVRLSNSDDIRALVSSVIINQAAGDMVLPAPWVEADLDDIRWDGSGDVVFLCCDGVVQKRIERQDRTSTPPSRSWSIVDYQPGDGPFGDLNTGPIEMKGSALTGDITLTTSKDYFRTTHVGGLFRLTSAGQQVTKRIQAQNTFSDPIKVTGVGASRIFTVTLAGPTFTGTTIVTIQRSVATPGNWTDQATYTAVQSVPFDDLLDNQVIYYRIGVKTGDFTALDDIMATLTFSAGSIDGIARVTAYTDRQNVSAAVLKDLGAAAVYTANWCEGDWSPKKGYPSGIARFDGRLWFAGKAFAWGSESDSLDGFDDTVEGDSATIKRPLGSGMVDKCNWILALNNLLIGTAGAVQVAKASSIDEPLTPTRISIKPSAIGSAPVRAAPLEKTGIYIGRNGSRVYQLSADASAYSAVPYAAADITALVPEIGAGQNNDLRFTRIGVQRYIDTRIHFVRSDGKVAIVIFDENEKVTCWLMVETDGYIEDVVVLPGRGATPTEDRVYYCVRRTIDGVTKRYLEKWALEAQARGLADNRIADSHVIYQGAAVTVVPGFGHLVGKEIVVWADGVCPADPVTDDPVLYTVAVDGTITLTTAASHVIGGLPYNADWQSAKLVMNGQIQAPLTKYKTINHVGVVAADLHARGIKVGQDFDHLTPLPRREGGKRVNPDTIHEAYDERGFPIDGTWDTDARVCIRAMAPRPATLLALSISGEG